MPSCYMEGLFLGVLNDRKLFHYQLLKVSILQLHMPPKKPSGFVHSSLNYSTTFLKPLPSFPITSQRLHLLKTINTMRGPNTSTSDSILFAGLSKMARFDSFTAQPKKWLLTHSQRPSHCQRSSISLKNLVSCWFEGECWNAGWQTNLSRYPKIYHHLTFFIYVPHLFNLL